ncbi:hypothetical protein CALCODRAFT_169201 [Calocera cornea HHB12733]|uniref:Uncharacterized protein n=1 Tax=Calocera cornea HHB12733 TaxID=1353952 RepID=A0A165CGZ0_9BASI|nr:hypothetical protein CALCODRAFT_169201 [Calocera cornea HHB12733]
MHNRKPPVGIGIGDASNPGGAGAGPSSVVMGGGADSRPQKSRKIIPSDAPGTGSSDNTAATTSPRSPTAARPTNQGTAGPYSMYNTGYPGAPPQSAGSGNQNSPNSANSAQASMGLPGGMGSYSYSTSPTQMFNPYPAAAAMYGPPQPQQNAATMPRAASAGGRQPTGGPGGAGVGGVGTTGSLSGWNSTGQTRR